MMHHYRNIEQTLIPITVIRGGTSRGFYFDGKNVPPQGKGIGAGVAKALGLDEIKTAAAIEICGQTGCQLLVARTTPISQWKGLSSSQVAFGCVNAVFLASRGVTGPKYVIEGSCGLAQ